MKAIGGQPDYPLGSGDAVTRDETLVIASASGSQLASYAWGATNVIFVVRARPADGHHSQVGKILESYPELLGASTSSLSASRSGSRPPRPPTAPRARP
jgi:hypothetical protein